MAVLISSDGYFSYSSVKNIHCGYNLERSRGAALAEYLQHIVMEKNSNTFFFFFFLAHLS